MNQRHSAGALADPCHDTEQILLQQVGADSDLEGEEFDGRSYMLHVAIEWLTRRLWRQHLAMMWLDITQVQFLEFQPSSPDQYLAVQDDAGELKMWFAGQPQSWAALLAQARTLDRSSLPEILWVRREMIPYLPLLFPYLLTATLGHAIDVVATDPRPSRLLKNSAKWDRQINPSYSDAPNTEGSPIMRGDDEQTTHMFSYLSPEPARAGRPSAPRRSGADGRSPADHVAPIREPVRHDRASVDPTGAIAARFTVAGALHGAERAAAHGRAQRQPAVPVVRRAEYG